MYCNLNFCSTLTSPESNLTWKFAFSVSFLYVWSFLVSFEALFLLKYTIWYNSILGDAKWQAGRKKTSRSPQVWKSSRRRPWGRDFTYSITQRLIRYIITARSIICLTVIFIFCKISFCWPLLLLHLAWIVFIMAFMVGTCQFLRLCTFIHTSFFSFPGTRLPLLSSVPVSGQKQ